MTKSKTFYDRVLVLFAAAMLVLGIWAFVQISPALACDTTDPSTHCGGGGVDPNTLTMQWGLTGYETPHMLAGATVTDEHGVSYTCPSWFRNTGNPSTDGCMDLTHTDYYRHQMNVLAQQLIALFGSKQAAFANAGIFAGWVRAQ